MRKHKKLFLTIIVLFITVSIGFYTKLYSGIGHEWINNKLGGVFYVIFWCLTFHVFSPKTKAFYIAVWVLIITCTLEFSQLLNNSFLEAIRSTYIGRTIIGISFTWSDFPYYFVGSVLGYSVLKIIERVK